MQYESLSFALLVLVRGKLTRPNLRNETLVLRRLCADSRSLGIDVVGQEAHAKHDQR